MCLMIDNLLRDVVKQQVHDNEVAVLLSGGVDSLSVGFAAEDVLGKKGYVHSYEVFFKHPNSTSL